MLGGLFNKMFNSEETVDYDVYGEFGLTIDELVYVGIVFLRTEETSNLLKLMGTYRKIKF